MGMLRLPSGGSVLRQVLLLGLLTASTSLAQAPGVAQAGGSAEVQESALTAAERDQVLDSVAAKLKDFYVLPDVARKMIDSLEANRKSGAYDALNGAMLAARLTSDLEGIGHDRHLSVVYSGAVLPTEEEEPSPDDQARYRRDLDRTNCGFQRVEVLP